MKIIITILTILISLPSFSQNEKVADIFDRFRDSQNFQVEFYNGNNRFTLTSRGKQFMVENIDADIIYNGKELYSINKKIKEIIVEELTGENILTNPNNIFTLDISNFTIEKIGDSYILTPIDIKKVGAESITLLLNSKDEIERLSITPAASESITFDIDKVVYNLATTPNFSFNKKEYTAYEIIDFR